MLVFAEAYEYCGSERFGLRFKDARDDWVRNHVSAARPPFSPVTKLPPALETLGDFADQGPSSGELGLGEPLTAARETFVPVLWCWFRAGESRLLLFADDQTMNVGMSAATTAFGEETRVKL